MVHSEALREDFERDKKAGKSPVGIEAEGYTMLVSAVHEIERLNRAGLADPRLLPGVLSAETVVSRHQCAAGWGGGGMTRRPQEKGTEVHDGYAKVFAAKAQLAKEADRTKAAEIQAQIVEHRTKAMEAAAAFKAMLPPGIVVVRPRVDAHVRLSPPR